MFRLRTIEVIVGLFMVVGFIALFILSFKVSGLTHYVSSKGYTIYAEFDNSGSLKVRAPVTMSGVRIGEVTGIQLDNKTFKARVTMKIEPSQNDIPADSSANIFTEGLLGSNYISLTPGFDEPPQVLKDGSVVQETHSAIILEKLIGQFMFNINKGEKK
ncbi:MAG: outer membrane lipid asymmetry maintenance protein MlaD [Proteobacteria bacterium]|nr:outer membrane lipid asymmetry maintenance protein MlaD [Pseudomonadota bacterium]